MMVGPWSMKNNQGLDFTLLYLIQVPAMNKLQIDDYDD